MKITRRKFVLILIGTFSPLLLWALRSFDLTRHIQEFFGFDSKTSFEVSRFAEVTRRSRPMMYFASTIFFSLARYNAESLIPRNYQHQILRYWGNHLLGKASIVRPYLNYPEVDDFLICNVLIRP